MKLTVVHQVLIASAIGLCAIFGLRSIVFGARSGDGVTLGLGVVGLVAAGALALYLRAFRKKLAAKDQRRE